MHMLTTSDRTLKLLLMILMLEHSFGTAIDRGKFKQIQI